MNAFSALAVPARLTIVETLARNGRLTATEISRHFTITASAISQHLKVLLDANLVLVERRGQQRIYQINPEGIAEVEVWATQIIQLWEQRLDSLDSFLSSADD
ncbi:MAG: metalloregulator ArsR/SmtB family transcription factor [Ardenticatenaceae bacterium]|nr:metalloregulator ArsR/SmtB family transcription factor [Ardenticatenaceae bacterium]